MRLQKPVTVLVLLSYLHMCFGPIVWALPNDGHVMGGSAAISQPTAQTLHINQTTDKAIINWKGFNIGADELVKFTQPSAGSIALNRVIGGDPSVILGQLLANGRIFLVNPNGILFGSSAVVNTAGLLATTFAIKDSDFMAGKYVFEQDPAKALSYVINKGQIHVSDSGFVLLVAPAVSNEGLIVANLGKVVLGSGEKLAVDFMGDGLITYAVDGKVLEQVKGPDGSPLTSAISNAGTIQADGGRVLLTTKAALDVFSSVINQSGIIEARSLVNHGGGIRLEGSAPVANTGTIGWQANLGKVRDASGKIINAGTLDVSAAEPGAAQGEVTLTGEMIGMAGAILARGAEGAQGGRVLITSSEKTVVTDKSVIDTSGTGHSSAGNVVVWSDKDTIFGGTISARGGALSGNGGNLEVSGHENLNFFGRVDALAPQGRIGTLLLDPRTITIAASGSSTPSQVDQFTDSPSTDRTISPTTINNAASNVILQANRDINVNNAISMTGAGMSLTMQAGRDVNVNANITTNNGAISLSANDSGAVSANRSTGTGDIVMAAGTTINAGSADIALTVGSSAAAPFSPGSITVRNLTTNGGNILINSPNAVTLNNAINAGSGTVTINANTDGAGAQRFMMNAGSSITTTNATADAIRLAVNAAGGGTGTVSLRDISAGNGALTIATNSGGNTTGGSITQSTGTSINVGTALLSTGNGAITLNNASNNFGTVAVSRATNVTLRNGNVLDFGASTISGTLNVTTSGALTQSGALAVTGATTLAVGTGNDITLTNAANNFSTVRITSGRSVTIQDANAMNLGTSTISGTLDVATNGALTQSGALAVTGTTTLAAGAGNDITLTNAANNFGTVGITSGRNVSLCDANALILGGSNVSGTLNITTGGTLTQSGALAVTATTSFTATAANTDVLLGTQANDFGGPLAFTGTLANFRDVSIRNVNAGATVPALNTLPNLRSLTLQFDNAPVTLPALTLTAGGNLAVTAGGAISDSGSLVVPGTTTLAAGANNITLDNANNFTGPVSVTTGNNVTLNDINVLVLGPSTVVGTLNVTTNGALTQSGPLTVAGTTTLGAGTGNDITLNHAGNNFSTIGITSGRNMTLVDSNSLTLSTSTISGTLDVTAGGILTQSGTLNVSGATTLAVGTANDILLNAAGNDFGTVAVATGRNVTLVDANALNLGASTISGNLRVTTNGALTQSGPLAVSGLTTLMAGAGNDITLNRAGNDFGTVEILSGRNVLMRDMNALNLGASIVSGTLDITTGGALTQSGALSVAGATTITAGSGNDVTLNDATNDFSTLGVVTGQNVTVSDANALDLRASAVSGTLNITTNGALTQSGPLTVTGMTTLSVGPGHDITLTDTSNSFNTIGVISGRNVSLQNNGALGLGALSASGALDVTANGAITDANGLANNITAATASLTGASIGSLADPIETNVGTVNVATTSGGIFLTQAGAVTLNNIMAGAGDIVIGNTVGDMTINTVTATAGGVELTAMAGSILDGDGTNNNITASANSSLRALGGVIGLGSDPLEVTINGGTFGVEAANQLNNISVTINGTVSPSNILKILNSPPGRVLFNGKVLFPLSSGTITGSERSPIGLGSLMQNSISLNPTMPVQPQSGAVILLIEDMTPESLQDEDHITEESFEAETGLVESRVQQEKVVVARTNLSEVDRQNATRVARPGDAGRLSIKESRQRQEEPEIAALRKAVLFDFEKSRISEDALQRLALVAEWLKANPTKRLIIEGHCDERGTFAYNLALGEKRARAVKAILVDLGVAPSRLTIVSYGEERPICAEHSETCYQQNRRGHLVLSLP